MEESRWQQFCTTGSIRDYLSYRACLDKETERSVIRHGYDRMKEEDRKTDAGLYRSNGNGIEKPSCRGL